MAGDYVLVDTDVFISLLRGRTEAVRYASLVEGRRIVLSFATVAELWLGAEILGYGKKSRKELKAGVAGTVVIPPTREVTREWARVVAQARSMSPGHALGQKAQYHDAWVAATALHHELPLLTANRRHFEGLPGLDLVDPNTGSA